MTAPNADAAFRFDTSYDTRDARLNLTASRRSARRVTYNLIFGILAAIGIACLFWRYTIALGVAILGIMAFVWAMRRRGEAFRKRYEASLQQPSQTVHVTLTESGYSLKGDDFFAEAKWSNVFNASERNGFLLMHSWQGARLRVPIDELQRAGLYERVRAIADARSRIAKR